MKISGKMTDKDAAESAKHATIINQHKLPRIWVLIADAGTAKIFKRDGESLEMIAGMKPAFAHAGTDKSEPYTHNIHSADKAFSVEIAVWLNEELRNDSYDRIVLIAAPRMLGNLRRSLSHNVYDRIVAEVSKDLTKMPEHELKGELEKIVWF